MSKSKPYKKQKAVERVACGPIMEYCSTSVMDNFVNSIPRDVLTQAIDFAIKEHKAGHCMPHTQIDEMAKERMGWK